MGKGWVGEERRQSGNCPRSLSLFVTPSNPPPPPAVDATHERCVGLLERSAPLHGAQSTKHRICSMTSSDSPVWVCYHKTESRRFPLPLAPMSAPAPSRSRAIPVSAIAICPKVAPPLCGALRLSPCQCSRCIAAPSRLCPLAGLPQHRRRLSARLLPHGAATWHHCGGARGHIQSRGPQSRGGEGQDGSKGLPASGDRRGDSRHATALHLAKVAPVSGEQSRACHELFGSVMM